MVSYFTCSLVWYKFKRFIQNRTIRKATLDRYRSDIKNYSLFLNLTPSEFIQEAIEEEMGTIRLSDRKIKDHLLDYKEYLIGKDYSPRSIISKLSTIKVFYTEFDIILPKINYPKRNIRHETSEDLPTKEEIRTALTFANSKYQAIIYIMVSSGLRSSDVRRLTYSNFLNSLSDYVKLSPNTYYDVDEIITILNKSDDLKVIKWKITTKKTNTPVTTFSTPETLEVLLRYLKTNPPKNLDSYLFCSNRYPDRIISDRAFAHYFTYLNNKCEFGKIDRTIKFHSHAFRKIFATALMKEGLQQLTISRLMGHSVKDLHESYIKQDDNTLKEQYSLCIGALSLRDTTVHHITTEDKKRLTELETLMSDKDLELEDTKKRLKRLERFMEEKERTDNLKKPDEK